MKKILLVLGMLTVVFSCGTKTETTEAEETKEEVVATVEEKTEEQLYEELNLELTEQYKEKGIKEISVAAYAKGIEAILILDDNAEISKDDFKVYAQEIVNKTKEKMSLPDSPMNVYLEKRANDKSELIYKESF